MNISKVVKRFFVFFLIIGLIGCSSTSKTEVVESDNESGKATKSDPQSGGDLNVAFSAQPPGLDPAVTTSQSTAQIMRHVYETLVTTDSKYNVQPMLAESYEQSADGKTITFHLRKGVTFHNGDELLAEDVVASMSRWATTSNLGKGYFEEALFKAEDDYTVVLSLPEPLSTALSVLAIGTGNFPAIMPKEIVENASEEGVKEYVGTGPFEFKEWKQDQYIQLVRFDDYQSRTEPADGLAGKREALVDTLTFTFSSDAATRIAGLQSGEYDAIEAVPRDNVEQLKSDPNLKTYQHPGNPLNVFFNKKEGLFSNVIAREAITVALDMADILTAVYSSDEYYDLSHNIVSPNQAGQWYSDEGKDKYNQHDPEKAKELLEQAGYNGEELVLITSRDYINMYDAAVVIQQQLEEIGVKVKLETYDWATFSEKRDNPDLWDLMVLSNSPKPEPSAQVFFSKEFAGWTNDAKLDELIAQFRSAPSIDAATTKFNDLQKWFWEYLPIAIIGYDRDVSAARSSVMNYSYLDGQIFWNVSNEK